MVDVEGRGGGETVGERSLLPGGPHILAREARIVMLTY